MKGLPLSDELARAWHEGRLTVHRRLMNPQPVDNCILHREDADLARPIYRAWINDVPTHHFYKPPYLPGEVVYIKETWVDLIKTPVMGAGSERYAGLKVWYRADNTPEMEVVGRYISPRFMPEWASRSHALIVSVKPERVQEITEEEAMEEGVGWQNTAGLARFTARKLSRSLWETLHPGTWDANPWVWRYELEAR